MAAGEGRVLPSRASTGSVKAVPCAPRRCESEAGSSAVRRLRRRPRTDGSAGVADHQGSLLRGRGVSRAEHGRPRQPARQRPSRHLLPPPRRGPVRASSTHAPCREPPAFGARGRQRGRTWRLVHEPSVGQASTRSMRRRRGHFRSSDDGAPQHGCRRRRPPATVRTGGAPAMLLRLVPAQRQFPFRPSPAVARATSLASRHRPRSVRFRTDGFRGHCPPATVTP